MALVKKTAMSKLQCCKLCFCFFNKETILAIQLRQYLSRGCLTWLNLRLKTH